MIDYEQYMQQYIQDNLEKIKEIVGEHTVSYQRKIAVLKEQFGKEDGIMRRELSSLLREDISPLEAALVVDNLAQFEKIYNESIHRVPQDGLPYLNLNFLHMACASPQVTHFFLAKFNASFTTDGFEDLLGYAAVSKNEAWIKEIAQQLIEAKKPMPMEIYDCTGSNRFKIIRMIRDMFGLNKASQRFTVNR